MDGRSHAPVVGAGCAFDAYIRIRHFHLKSVPTTCFLALLLKKASLMRDSSPAIPRLGIPEWHWWSEALHGVGRNGTATVFPITMQMASTFDDALVERIFTAVSDEGRAKNSIAKRAGRLDNNRCTFVLKIRI